MNRHLVLNYLDTPLKILFWTIPELLLLVIPWLLGVILNQLTLGLAVSVANWWLHKKYQQLFGKGQFHAVRYWWLPPDPRLKNLPPSFIREFIG